jgi:2'-5' RNA ligase
MRSGAVREQLSALEAPMTVEAVHLYRSHLTKDGARHEVIASASFGR